MDTRVFEQVLEFLYCYSVGPTAEVLVLFVMVVVL